MVAGPKRGQAVAGPRVGRRWQDRGGSTWWQDLGGSTWWQVASAGDLLAGTQVRVLSTGSAVAIYWQRGGRPTQVRVLDQPRSPTTQDRVLRGRRAHTLQADRVLRAEPARERWERDALAVQDQPSETLRALCMDVDLDPGDFFLDVDLDPGDLDGGRGTTVCPAIGSI